MPGLLWTPLTIMSGSPMISGKGLAEKLFEEGMGSSTLLLRSIGTDIGEDIQFLEQLFLSLGLGFT